MQRMGFFPLVNIFGMTEVKRQAYHLSSDCNLLLVELTADLAMGMGIGTPKLLLKYKIKKERTYFIVL